MGTGAPRAVDRKPSGASDGKVSGALDGKVSRVDLASEKVAMGLAVK
jgi:hypothetical protein